MRERERNETRPILTGFQVQRRTVKKKVFNQYPETTAQSACVIVWNRRAQKSVHAGPVSTHLADQAAPECVCVCMCARV